MSLLKLDLNRQISTKNSTTGKLCAYVEDVKVFQCYTLEDATREVAGTPVAQWKVHGKTAIPRGTYNLMIGPSKHFGKDMVHVLGVEGFEGVLLHGGNDAGDTDGCVLLGTVLGPGPDRISNCKPAVNTVFRLVKEAGQGPAILVVN